MPIHDHQKVKSGFLPVCRVHQLKMVLFTQVPVLVSQALNKIVNEHMCRNLGIKQQSNKNKMLIYLNPIYKITAATTRRTAELECEFPPKMEEDLTHVRRKRLTTKNGLVCLEDYPYTVSVRFVQKASLLFSLQNFRPVFVFGSCFNAAQTTTSEQQAGGCYLQDFS